jgi:hypothetical protein
MNIILFVTTEAGGLEVLLIERALVTSCAFRLHVFAPQREFCITIVVEDDAFPIPFRVAVATFGAKAPLMAFLVIVGLMTGVTFCLQFFFIEHSLMASGTFGEAMFSA